MRFLCVADQIDPSVYSSTAKQRFADIDAVLCAGDLPMDYIDFVVSTLNKPTFFIFGNHNLKDFSYYHGGPAQSQIAGRPAAITHCHGAEYAGFRVLAVKDLMLTDAQTHRKTPLLIAGVSGSLRYNNGINQYSETEMFFKLLHMWPRLLLNRILYGRYLDILLTHAAPRHIHDLEDSCHRGFECFRWFMKKFQPVWLVHGHIHLYDVRTERVTQFGATTVVNAYGYYIIEIPPK